MHTFTSIDPTNGQPLSHQAAATPDQCDATLSAAIETATRWASTPLPERAALLHRVGRLLEQDEQDLAALMTREMGKPWTQARAEIRKCAWTVRHFADHGPAMLADEAIKTDARSSFVCYRPLGALFAIMPWNFPFWQFFRFGAPALLAGNVIVFKHAPSTMGCGERIAALFRQAGAPRGLVQHLPVTTDVASTIIADPRIAGVTLTGSTRAGRAVAAIAGANLKPVVLELGGSDPFIVMPSADIDAAVATAVASRTGNNGQSCIAAKRIIVHAAIADTFETRVVAAMQALRIGNPMDESVAIGPLASAAARDHLDAQVRATIAAGARCLTGGTVMAGPGFFYPPTVLADIPPDSPAARDELFGPVMPIFRVPSFDAAIASANDSDYGLTATLFSRDEQEQAEARERLRVGGLFINAMSRSDARLPFGGVGASGFGRELGRAGMQSFCNIKSIWVD